MKFNVRVYFLLKNFILLSYLLDRLDWVEPGDVFQDCFQARVRADMGPEVARVVNDAKLRSVETLVEVELDMVLPKEPVANGFEVIRIAGLEGPARK